MTGSEMISSADRAFYAAHGWWVSPRVLPGDLLQRAARGIQEIHAGFRDFSIPIEQKPHLNWRDGSQFLMRIHNYAAHLHPGIRELLQWPGFGEICAYIADTDEVRLFNSTIVDKPPSAAVAQNVVGWHADRAYWQTCSSKRMFTAWIPFQDCDPTLGPLTVLDGSHLWPDEGRIYELRRVKNFITDGSLNPRCELESMGYSSVAVPMLLKQGQFSIHHCMAFHGSAPNRSTRNRVSLTVHLQDGSNEWQRVPLEGGREAIYQHDGWCARTEAGLPNYRDPFVCPLLWSAPFGREYEL